MLFGDSHAAMWFPAVDDWANAQGYRLYVFTKAACPPVSIVIFSPVLDRTWTECRDWYADAISTLATIRPSLVVLGIAPNYDSAYDVVQDGPPGSQVWPTPSPWSGATGGGFVDRLGSRARPRRARLPLGALDHVSACEFSPVGQRVSGGGLVGLDRPVTRSEAATVSQAGGLYADIDPWFCTAATCDVVVDNLLVYRDNSHVTVSFADYLAPLVGDEMALALTTS